MAEPRTGGSRPDRALGDAVSRMVSSQHNDDNSLAKREAYRRRHMERLGLQPALELV